MSSSGRLLFGYGWIALMRFLRGDADLFAKLQVLQQNAAYFSASARPVADPAISKYSSKYCGPAFTVDSLSLIIGNQGRLLSLFALTQMHQQDCEKELDRIPLLLFISALGKSMLP